MSKLADIAIATTAIAGCTTAPSPTASYKMVDNNGHCLVEVDGKLLEAEDAAKSIKSAVRTNNEIVLIASRNAPYKSVGAAIYYLQRAGFSEVTFRPE